MGRSCRHLWPILFLISSCAHKASLGGDYSHQGESLGERSQRLKVSAGALVLAKKASPSSEVGPVRRARAFLPTDLDDLLWPVPASEFITSFYGPRGKVGHHDGIDIYAQEGRYVLASARGKVVSAGHYGRGYGQTIVLDHGHGVKTIYAHTSQLLVKKGQVVAKGQSIARVGKTGNASGPHLHFELRRYGKAFNPMPHLYRVLEEF